LHLAADREDVRDVLEPALARAVEESALADAETDGPAWLALFAAAAALTEDERILQASVDLAKRLRNSWGRSASVETAAHGVDAYLSSSHLVGTGTVSDAVDELERLVSGAYTPGSGLASRLHDESGPHGRLADHVRLSSALLTAFEVTGRLPYSMLAEELVQWARRSLWDDSAALFRESPAESGHPFAGNCDAARVLLRLSSLHGQAAYRQAAVLAPGADYGRDACRILDAHRATYQQQGLASAVYGLALFEELASA
jgi:uncharacterized protein YyaL (SSP411 family)